MTPLSYHLSNLSLIALETMRLLVQKTIDVKYFLRTEVQLNSNMFERFSNFNATNGVLGFNQRKYSID